MNGTRLFATTEQQGVAGLRALLSSNSAAANTSGEKIQIDSKDSTTGHTALHRACVTGSQSTALILIENGAPIDAADMVGMTPLHWCCWEGHLTLAISLIQRGAHINQKDAVGNTPLLLAARAKKNLLATLLISMGASVNVADNEGTTPLHWAVCQGCLDVVASLLQAGATTDAQTSHSRGRTTPLVWAAAAGVLEIATLLIQRGASVNYRDVEGRSPLHWAVAKSTPRMASLLIASGADVFAKDSSGATSRDLAQKMGSEEMISLLLAAELQAQQSYYGNTATAAAAAAAVYPSFYDAPQQPPASSSLAMDAGGFGTFNMGMFGAPYSIPSAIPATVVPTPATTVNPPPGFAAPVFSAPKQQQQQQQQSFAMSHTAQQPPALPTVPTVPTVPKPSAGVGLPPSASPSVLSQLNFANMQSTRTTAATATHMHPPPTTVPKIPTPSVPPPTNTGQRATTPIVPPAVVAPSPQPAPSTVPTSTPDAPSAPAYLPPVIVAPNYAPPPPPVSAVPTLSAGAPPFHPPGLLPQPAEKAGILPIPIMQKAAAPVAAAPPPPATMGAKAAVPKHFSAPASAAPTPVPPASSTVTSPFAAAAAATNKAKSAATPAPPSVPTVTEPSSTPVPPIAPPAKPAKSSVTAKPPAPKQTPDVDSKEQQLKRKAAHPVEPASSAAAAPDSKDGAKSVRFAAAPAPAPRDIVEAALAKSEERLRKALAAGLSVNTPLDSQSMLTPLMSVAVDGNEEAVDFLLCHGADAALHDARERTALHLAALHNHGSVIARLLMEKQCRIDASDCFGKTPLLLAAGRENRGSVALLLEKGADPGHVDFQEKNAVHTAIASPDTLKVILAHVAASNTGKRFDIDAKDSEGKTALFLAAQGGQAASISALLAAGADPDIAEASTGMTPLMAACSSPKLDPVTLLLDATRNVHAVDNNSHCALHYIAKWQVDPANRLKINALVASLAPSKFVCAPNVETPLHTAIDNRRFEMATLLAANGASINDRNASGQTAVESLADKRWRKQLTEAYLKWKSENKTDIGRPESRPDPQKPKKSEDVKAEVKAEAKADAEAKAVDAGAGRQRESDETQALPASAPSASSISLVMTMDEIERRMHATYAPASIMSSDPSIAKLEQELWNLESRKKECLTAITTFKCRVDMFYVRIDAAKEFQKHVERRLDELSRK